MCLNSVLNVKAVVAAFNQEKALVGDLSVITNLRMELFEALVQKHRSTTPSPGPSRGELGNYLCQCSKYTALCPIKADQPG